MLELLKTKTVRLAIIGLIGALYAFWTGEIALKDLFEAGYVLLTAVTLRHAVAKSGPGA